MKYWIIKDSNDIVVGYMQDDGTDARPVPQEGQSLDTYVGDIEDVHNKVYQSDGIVELSDDQEFLLRYGTIEAMRSAYLAALKGAIDDMRGYLSADQEKLYEDKYQEALRVYEDSTADIDEFPKLAPEVGIKHATIQLLAAACIENYRFRKQRRDASEVVRVACQQSINSADTCVAIHGAFRNHFPDEEV